METIKTNINTEEIYKCSKCGLCQKFCPVYNATKNEFFLPRGRYIVLNDFVKNKKQLSQNFIKTLDICLNCNLCKKYCPSDIDYQKILSSFKKEKKELFFNKKFKKILLINKIFSFIYKFFPLKSIFLNSNIDKLYNVKTKRNHKKIKEKKANVVYFQGCVNKYINPSDKNASLNILEKFGYRVISINNNCCGYPLLCDANTNGFELNAEKIINSIPNDVEYIVCSCKTCYETLQNIEQIKDKLIMIDDLIKIEHNHNENYILYDKEYSLMQNLFMLKQPKIAKQIAKTFDFADKITYTSCLLTKWSLAKHNIKSCSTAEMIEMLINND